MPIKRMFWSGTSNQDIHVLRGNATPDLLAAVIVGGALLAAFFLLQKWQTAEAPAANLAEDNQAPSSIDNLPKNPNFALADPGSTARPLPGASDSPTAVRFKAALRDWYTLRTAGKAAAQRPAPVALDLTGTTNALVTAVDPRVAIPRRGLSFIGISSWIRSLIGNDFNEVMAYPKIDLPMYEPLKAISIELLLPNISLIPPNSITLIETNQKFIESYMVGLNHEFARKLLWRGYPTDQRGLLFPSRGKNILLFLLAYLQYISLKYHLKCHLCCALADNCFSKTMLHDHGTESINRPLGSPRMRLCRKRRREGLLLGSPVSQRMIRLNATMLAK
jgi:hypothetical protein